MSSSSATRSAVNKEQWIGGVTYVFTIPHHIAYTGCLQPEEVRRAPQVQRFAGPLRSESCPYRRMAANLEVQGVAPNRYFDTQ